jgi:hypothetical protein
MPERRRSRWWFAALAASLALGVVAACTSFASDEEIAENDAGDGGALEAAALDALAADASPFDAPTADADRCTAPLGVVEPLARNELAIQAIAVDGTTVYWTTGGLGGQVRSVEHTQPQPAAPTTFAAAVNAGGVALVGTRVAWIAGSGSKSLYSKPKAGGTAIQLSSSATGNALALTGSQTNRVYFARGTELSAVDYATVDGPISSIFSITGISAVTYSAPHASVVGPLDGGTAVIGCSTNACSPGARIPVATNQGAIAGVASDTDAVYWTTGTEVRTAPHAAGAVVTLAADQPDPTAIAVNEELVYFGTSNGLRSVGKKPGDCVAVMSTGAVTHVATNGSFVYFVVGNDILRLPK